MSPYIQSVTVGRLSGRAPDVLAVTVKAVVAQMGSSVHGSQPVLEHIQVSTGKLRKLPITLLTQWTRSRFSLNHVLPSWSGVENAYVSGSRSNALCTPYSASLLFLVAECSADTGTISPAALERGSE